MLCPRQQTRPIISNSFKQTRIYIAPLLLVASMSKGQTIFPLKQFPSFGTFSLCQYQVPNFARIALSVFTSQDDLPDDVQHEAAPGLHHPRHHRLLRPQHTQVHRGEDELLRLEHRDHRHRGQLYFTVGVLHEGERVLLYGRGSPQAEPLLRVVVHNLPGLASHHHHRSCLHLNTLKYIMSALKRLSAVLCKGFFNYFQIFCQPLELFQPCNV